MVDEGGRPAGWVQMEFTPSPQAIMIGSIALKIE
jgi:hypothetical protein